MASRSSSASWTDPAVQGLDHPSIATLSQALIALRLHLCILLGPSRFSLFIARGRRSLSGDALIALHTASVAGALAGSDRLQERQFLGSWMCGPFAESTDLGTQNGEHSTTGAES